MVLLALSGNQRPFLITPQIKKLKARAQICLAQGPWGLGPELAAKASSQREENHVTGYVADAFRKIRGRLERRSVLTR